jgi:hypothetical protein
MHSSVSLPTGFRSLAPPFCCDGARRAVAPLGGICAGDAALGGAALGAGLGRTRVGG